MRQAWGMPFGCWLHSRRTRDVRVCYVRGDGAYVVTKPNDSDVLCRRPAGMVVESHPAMATIREHPVETHVDWK
jgi:hypothetical protein